MRFKEIFIISKGTKVILSITFSVSFLALLFAFFYYRGINKSEDPRVIRAREYLLKYDKVSETNNDLRSFAFLDSASAIFKQFPDYESSFETGLIYNNKCSALLLMAIYDSTIREAEKNSLLDLAMKYCDSSIAIYERWMTDWESLSSEKIITRMGQFMKEDDPSFNDVNFNKVFSRRVKNIITAQLETPRRLSVSLTNKGTIYRHMLKSDSSLTCYEQALLLWKDNRTAKSNLSVLMGHEPIEPTIIESLFPPDKNKK